jgi:LmbE family N-acetylglucosaminyl deacetylase
MGVLNYMALLPFRGLRRAFRDIRRPIVRHTLRNLCGYAVRRDVQDASAFFVAPHPDDEVFGVGGVIALKRAAGVDVEIVFLTDGESAHKNCCDISRHTVAAARRDLAIAAAGIVGIPPDRMHWLCLPSGRIPGHGQEGFAEAVAKVMMLIAAARPREVYYPYRRDCWPDHEAAAEIVERAVAESGVNCATWCYLVWAWYKSSFTQAWTLARAENVRVVDINDVLPKKIKAMETYLSCHPPTCSIPYIGHLPKGFSDPFRKPYELLVEACIRPSADVMALGDVIGSEHSRMKANG